MHAKRQRLDDPGRTLTKQRRAHLEDFTRSLLQMLKTRRSLVYISGSFTATTTVPLRLVPPRRKG